MNIITAAQTRDADRHTIETDPIASIDLMERASGTFVTVFMQLYPDRNTSILVCCGTGNNGGDGLAIARLLQAHGYDEIAVWIARFSDRESDDFSANLARLHNTPIPITEFFPGDELPVIHQAVVIDALLGSGLNKPLTGDWLRLVQHINEAASRRVAVDIPTGLPPDGIIPEAQYTVYTHDVISFQRPKLSFFFPESAKAIERFHVVDIGLDESFIERLPSDFSLITAADIQRIYHKRKPFTHKGTYGHALLIAGDSRTMGAALLSCGASLYSGAGLTSACIPPEGLVALNTSHPEVMYCPAADLPEAWDKFDAVGIGPGLGQREKLLAECLTYVAKPLVIDADAINLLARASPLMGRLPGQCILTPHMKEFDRLFGTHRTWWDRLCTAREQAEARHIILVLKNRYTFIVTPDGKVYINPTGNPAMASGGTGDVLTGMLTSFLAQHYTPEEAAILACYLHGAAGDLLANEGMAVVPAGRLLENIPRAIGTLNQQNS
ncbi:NAD(P)H-hydrate dehydratase [Parapedobacter koreensis]|uniref:Bifunctional NAD(P)H-hydrate repair enzyme n=1 Tax=Parapedobacter koreensis TaxID=332977 RepID=A0A1H7F2G1_9SPHI|nr:NAD(P)H-hydrate dehydratase [Parapedobacter koreensis]SEK18190.1 NAD(P)H-hydrate epimerase [Parapedobacter koreensis]